MHHFSPSSPSKPKQLVHLRAKGPVVVDTNIKKTLPSNYCYDDDLKKMVDVNDRLRDELGNDISRA
jgi:hypothetical protein